MKNPVLRIRTIIINLYSLGALAFTYKKLRVNINPKMLLKNKAKPKPYSFHQGESGHRY
ncbi:hypothetical protein D3C87_1826320 [compost metagenome]